MFATKAAPTATLIPGIVSSAHNAAIFPAFQPVIALRAPLAVRAAEEGEAFVSAFYSLLGTAKLAELDPAAYLAEETRRAIEAPGTVTLPRDLAS